jgi:ATP-dependent Clp protease, protease subunit
MTSGLVSFPPEPSDWGASLRARMFDRRVVFLVGPLTDDSAGRAAMELMTLDASGDSAVQLQIESPIGELGAALAIMDVIDTMGVNVAGVAMGLVGGPALGVLAVCARRVSMPHARFHFREPDAVLRGDARTIDRWLSFRRQQWTQYCERFGAAIGRPTQQLESLWADGSYLGANDALAMGLVQEIARPTGEVKELRRPGFANED